MNDLSRKPAVFRPDDPRLLMEEREPAAPPADAIREPAESVTVVPEEGAPRGFRLRWGTLFWSSLSGLLVFGLGIAVVGLVEDLFARAPWLGAVGSALAATAGLALAALSLREIFGLARLARAETLRRRALEIIETDNREAGRALVADLLALTKPIPRLARARRRLASHRSEIIDGRDLIGLAERELMAPLDAEARRMVATASKRVSVVTALSPRAAVDILFVLLNTLSLIRQLTVLYGGQPGVLGIMKLFRQVVSHLAFTGGAAVSDSVLQQLVGHGLAARLSARLGEGLVNGLLTARLGLLAIELVRPLPFGALPKPGLNELAGTLLRSSGDPGPVSGAADSSPGRDTR